MRKLLIVLAVVFATSLFTATGVQAATYPTKKPMVRHHIVRKHKVTVVCRPVKRRARPARAARGPVLRCPTPVVNVPRQPAPVVNVPQQPAPVVNIPPSPPTVGVTADNTNLYIVRENQLTVLDKCTYEVKKTMTLP